MRYSLVMAALALAACSGPGATEPQEPGTTAASEPGTTPGASEPGTTSANAGSTVSPGAAASPEATTEATIPETPTEAPFANLGSRTRTLGSPTAVSATDLAQFENAGNSTIEVIKAQHSAVWAAERKSFRLIEEAAR